MLKLGTVVIMLASSGISGQVETSRVLDGQTPSSLNISDDYVRTPRGYSHRSCVIGVRKGEFVQADGSVRRVDGTTLRVQPCASPTLDGDGNVVVRPSTQTRAGLAAPDCIAACGLGAPGSSPPLDYIAWFWANQEPSVWEINGSWVVPDLPQHAVSPNFLALWNGLMSSTTYEVLQPVLQFGASGIGWLSDPCGQDLTWKWSLMAWDWRSDSNWYTSCADIVYPGQTITGVVDSANGVYLIRGYVDGNVYNTWLEGVPNGPIDQIMGGILEAHDIHDCNQLPGGSTSTYWNEPFNNVYALDQSRNLMYPNWISQTNPTWSSWSLPSCDVQASPGWLHWRSRYQY